MRSRWRFDTFLEVARFAPLVALGGVCCAAVACVSLAGLSGGEPADPVESGTDATPVDATPPDPCRHAFPPAEPAVDDDPMGEVAPFIVAVREASLAGSVDGGMPIGFDLDGVCSCFTDPTTAHKGETSCAPREGGTVTCDGDGGADNAVNTLLAAYPDFLGGSTARGGPTMLIKIAKYNGRANDREVLVAVVASPGHYDTSGCPDAGPIKGDPPYPPTWKGCDRWAVDPGYLLPGTSEPSTFVPAYVVDHMLVVTPLSKPVMFLVATTTFPLTGARVMARLVALDTELRPLQPQPEVGERFALDEGVIAGRATTGDMLRALAASLARLDGGPLCGTPALFTAIKTQFICPGADVTGAPSLDFTSAGCDALSVASAFAAEPARFGEVRPLDPTPCGDLADPKLADLFDCSVSP